MEVGGGGGVGREWLRRIRDIRQRMEGQGIELLEWVKIKYTLMK